MKKSAAALLVGVALLLAPAAIAQEVLVPITITPDVIYGHKMGMALTFDVLRPVNANGAGVMFMVSGGWFSQYTPPERAARRFTGLLNEGFTVFAVRHGSAPLFKVPDAVEDVRRATRFIHMHAADYGIDPDRLGVTGGSAGGHLSLVLGTTGDEGDPEATDPVMRHSNRVAAVVAYFPPVDLTQITGPSERFPALDFEAKKAEAISPIYYVSGDDPPSLMIHGDADELVALSNSQRILAAFEEQGVETNLIVIEGAPHGFRGADAVEASKARAAWFVAHLGGDGN